MKYEEIIEVLQSKINEQNRIGMARFGINTENALGISVTEIRKLAKSIEKSNDLAIKLWESNLHEARILATIIADKDSFDIEAAKKWAKEFNSWDITDQAAMNLFKYLPFIYDLIDIWAESDEIFEKRAAFACIATIGGKQKNLESSRISHFLTVIIEKADDERNFVKKAVNWALREIGKRNERYRQQVVAICEEKLSKKDLSKAEKFVYADALKELSNEKIIERVAKKKLN